MFSVGGWKKNKQRGTGGLPYIEPVLPPELEPATFHANARVGHSDCVCTGRLSKSERGGKMIGGWGHGERGGKGR